MITQKERQQRDELLSAWKSYYPAATSKALDTLIDMQGMNAIAFAIRVSQGKANGSKEMTGMKAMQDATRLKELEQQLVNRGASLRALERMTDAFGSKHASLIYTDWLKNGWQPPSKAAKTVSPVETGYKAATPEKPLTVTYRDAFWGGTLGTKELIDVPLGDALQAFADALKISKPVMDQLRSTMNAQTLYTALQGALQATGGSTELILKVNP